MTAHPERPKALSGQEMLDALIAEWLAKVKATNVQRPFISERELALKRLQSIATLLREESTRMRAEAEEPRVIAEWLAIKVLDHIEQMYPSLWKYFSRSARLSIRNTIINGAEHIVKEEREKAVHP